jgi:hypothetical protein
MVDLRNAMKDLLSGRAVGRERDDLRPRQHGPMIIAWDEAVQEAPMRFRLLCSFALTVVISQTPALATFSSSQVPPKREIQIADHAEASQSLEALWDQSDVVARVRIQAATPQQLASPGP